MSDRAGDWGELDGIYEALAASEGVPGLVYGLVGAGGLAHVRGIGLADLEAGRPVTADAGFRIASMTKNVTALAILNLRDEGLLRLDAPVAAYIPAFGAVRPTVRDAPPATLRDLLSHTAGFVVDDPWADRLLGASPSELDGLISDGELFARATGVAFEYSNLGYALLGRIVAHASGRPYQTYVRETLLGPLGMASTTFDYYALAADRRAVGYRRLADGWSPETAEADGEFAAMGGLVTTASDYARFVAFLLDAWPPRDDPDSGPVRRSSRRELAAVHAAPSPPSTRELGDRLAHVSSAYGYGLANAVDDVLSRYLHHSGGLPGWGSHVLLSPDCGIGLFALANRTYAPMQKANFQAAALLERTGRWRPRPVETSEALLTAAALVRQAYRSGDIDKAGRMLADNLLLDEPASERNAGLLSLKQRLGDDLDLRLHPRHLRAARFELAAERGAVGGDLVLTPGPDPKIQFLRFDEPD